MADKNRLNISFWGKNLATVCLEGTSCLYEERQITETVFEWKNIFRKYALLHTIAWPLTKDSTLFVQKCISSDMLNLLALIEYIC
jgi:hypothetical protein